MNGNFDGQLQVCGIGISVGCNCNCNCNSIAGRASNSAASTNCVSISAGVSVSVSTGDAISTRRPMQPMPNGNRPAGPPERARARLVRS